MGNREGYKKTKIGWIPEDWDVVVLDKITSKMTNGFVGSATPHYTEDSDGVTYIQGYNVKQNSFNFHGIKKVTRAFHEEQSKSKLKKNDLVTIQTGAIGTTAVIPAELEGSNCHALIITRYDEGSASPLYVSQFINSQKGQEQIKSIETGTTMKHVNVKDFKKYSLPLPPLPEQKKIASILTTVDDKISSIDQQIQQTEQLKKGLMEKLLTEGIGHTEFKETKIGRIPKGWSIKTLGQIGEFLKGKGIAKKDLVEHGLPCVRYGEIYTVHHWRIKRFYSFITADVASQSTLIEKNDILFAGSGETVEDIGKAIAYLDDIEAYAGGDTVILRPENVDSAFISACLDTAHSNRQKRKLGQGNSVVHIYSAGLKQLTVPIPPLKEQKQIATILSAVDDKIDILTKKKTHYQTLKKGLSQQLLTGQIRVKI